MKLQIKLPTEEIAAFCRHWGIAELAIFGSSTRADFHADSDVDLLVTFVPGKRVSLPDWMTMQRDLSVILGRQVDLVDKNAILQSDNYIRRKHILENAQVVYGS